MIEKYLDEIKDIIKEKNIPGKDFSYAVRLGDSFWFLPANDLNNYWKTQIDVSNWISIYDEMDNYFSIYAPSNAIFNERNITWHCEFGESFLTDFLARPGVKFSVKCNTDLNFFQALQNKFEKYEGYKSYKEFTNVASCQCSINGYGDRNFEILYFNKENHVHFLGLQLRKDGSVDFAIGKHKNQQLFQLHYEQQFLKQLKDFKIPISQAVKKTNKRFYERFEKYLT